MSEFDFAAAIASAKLEKEREMRAANLRIEFWEGYLAALEVVAKHADPSLT